MGTQAGVPELLHTSCVASPAQAPTPRTRESARPEGPRRDPRGSHSRHLKKPHALRFRHAPALPAPDRPVACRLPINFWPETPGGAVRVSRRASARSGPAGCAGPRLRFRASWLRRFLPPISYHLVVRVTDSVILSGGPRSGPESKDLGAGSGTAATNRQQRAPISRFRSAPTLAGALPRSARCPAPQACGTAGRTLCQRLPPCAAAARSPSCRGWCWSRAPSTPPPRR